MSVLSAMPAPCKACRARHVAQRSHSHSAVLTLVHPHDRAVDAHGDGLMLRVRHDARRASVRVPAV